MPNFRKLDAAYVSLLKTIISFADTYWFFTKNLTYFANLAPKITISISTKEIHGAMFCYLTVMIYLCGEVVKRAGRKAVQLRGKEIEFQFKCISLFQLKGTGNTI